MQLRAQSQGGLVVEEKLERVEDTMATETTLVFGGIRRTFFSF